MFQPDGLLAEVLAAVAGPEGGPTPDAAAPAPLPAAQAPAPAPVAAPVIEPVAAAPTSDELRVFVRDFALVSELHLRVLDRFSREGLEKVLGRTDVQGSVGGSAAQVSSILEDFVQARLVRRRRSPRVRGGTGFLYSPSPKTRNAATRLLRLYEDPASRAEVLRWVQGARQK